MSEVWQVVPSFDGLYEASNLGRIRSWRKPGGGLVETPRIIKGSLDANGYRTMGHRPKPVRFHRMVCEAFHGPAPEDARLVRHLDGNRLNNVPENLAWGTHAENTADMLRLGEIKTGADSPFTKTHCKRGHELAGDNLYFPPYGGGRRRQCRACGRAWKREQAEKVKIESIALSQSDIVRE